MTNADKMRSLSNHEIAQWLVKSAETLSEFTVDELEEWLQEEYVETDYIRGEIEYG